MYCFRIALDNNVIHRNLSYLIELKNYGLIDLLSTQSVKSERENISKKSNIQEIIFTNTQPINTFPKDRIKNGKVITKINNFFSPILPNMELDIDTSIIHKLAKEEFVSFKKALELPDNDINRRNKLGNVYKDISIIVECLEAEIDIFVTEDKALIEFADYLFSQKIINFKTFNLRSCNYYLESYYRNDLEINNKEELVKLGISLPYILIGTNAMNKITIIDENNWDKILHIETDSHIFRVELNLYDDFGEKIGIIKPNIEPEILTGKLVAKLCGGKKIIFGNHLGNGFVLQFDKKFHFSGRVLSNGRLKLGGKLYNSKGNLVFDINKDFTMYSGKTQLG